MKEDRKHLAFSMYFTDESLDAIQELIIHYYKKTNRAVIPAKAHIINKLLVDKAKDLDLLNER